MAEYVDGTKTAPDANGIVQGNGGAVDKLAGDGDRDILQGHAAFNQYFGGAGNDTFILSSKMAHQADAYEGASTKFSNQFAYIADFGGAGGWSGTNNDFIALTGWGAGSHIDLVKSGASGTPGATLYYYTITDGVTHEVFNFMINSLNGKALGKGDFNFY